MCHHEGYHRAMAWEIEGGDSGPREQREELPYDLPWRAMAVVLGVVIAIGAGLSAVIGLLA